MAASIGLKNIQAIAERGRVADFLRVNDYDENSGIYMTLTGMGFIFECVTLPYAVDSIADTLEQLYKSSTFVKPVYISICLYASPNINDFIQDFKARKNSGQGSANPESRIDINAVKELFNNRANYFQAHTRKSLFTSIESRPRDFRLFVSVNVPMDDKLMMSDDIMRNMINLKSSIKSSLEQCGTMPVDCRPQRYIGLMREILNTDYENKPNVYNPLQDLREQVIYQNTNLSVTDTGDIIINGKCHRVLSVKDYPPSMNLYAFTELYGAYSDNHRQIPVPFVVTLNLKLVDTEKQKDTFQKQRMYRTYQADGNPAAKYFPKLWDSYNNFQLGEELYKDGHVQTPMSISIWIQGEDMNELSYMSKRVETIWQQKGYRIYPENGATAFTMFLGMLPLQYDTYVEKFSKRSQSLFSNNAAMQTPICSDWKGNSEPYMAFISRKGQVVGFDPFGSNSNYNIAVVATSGSGKSFFTAEQICALLAEGGKGYVIDIGRSYEPLCRDLGGEFIEFDKSKKIVVNPFTHAVTNEKGELDAEELDVLIPLFGAMIGVNLFRGEDQKSAADAVLLMKYSAYLERAIVTTFNKLKNDTMVCDVIDTLRNMKSSDQVTDSLATALQAYDRDGRFSPYINGKDSFDYSKDLIVLELDSLENIPALRGLILMMIFMRINQDVYKESVIEYDENGKQKPIRKKQLIVDEAWDLMKTSMTAAFIERAFRRFRKHNASAVVVTQGLSDFFENSTTEAIYANCAWKIFLKQNSDTIEKAKADNQLNMQDYFFDMLKSIRTVKGEYSEFMIMGEESIAVNRLVVDRYAYYLYTTNAVDKNKIRTYRDKYGLNIKDAIHAIIRDEKQGVQ